MAKSKYTFAQVEGALDKATALKNDDDGTKFLANDGTYKEVSGGSGGSGTSIDDTTTTATDKTWSASKIKREIDNKTVSDSQISSAVNSYLTENPVTGVVNSLSDMNIVLMGDSITDTDRYAELNGRGRWVEPFRKLANPKSLKNYAVDGCTWSFWRTTTETTAVNAGWNKDNVIWNQVNRLKADVTAGTVPIPDLIMIMAGANDSFNASGSIQNGTPSTVFATAAQSSTLSDLANISASIRKTCDDLRTAYPNAKIVLITPFVCGNFSEYTKLIAIRKVIEECAMYLGLYTIDGSKAGFIWHEEQNASTNLISDHTHLTLLGGRRAGKMIYDELCSMPFIYTDTQFNKSIDDTIVALESLEIVGADEVSGGGSWTTYKYNITPTFANNINLEWSLDFASGGSGRMNGDTLIFYGGEYVDMTLKDKISGISTTKRVYKKSGETTPTSYTVTNNLTNVTNSYSATSIEEGQAYNATLTASTGYTLGTVTVTMGGTDITSTAYSNGTISIASVTGNIVITANATPADTTVHATNITLSPTAVSFDTAGDTSTVTATLAPSNTTDTVVSWTSNNTAVATVDNGVITAVANGTATITAKTSNDLTATVSVTVNIATSGGDGTPNGHDKVIDSSNLLYQNSETLSFNGTSTIVNTGVSLPSEYTVIIEFDNPTASTNSNVLTSTGSNTTKGFSLNGKNGNANIKCGYYDHDLQVSEQHSKPVKVIVTKLSDSTTANAYVGNTTAIPMSNFVEGDSTTIHLGSRYKASTSAWASSGFNGTIYDCRVYSRVITNEEISTYMSN